MRGKNIFKILFGIVLFIGIGFGVLYGYNKSYEKKIDLDFVERGIMAHACGAIDGIDYTNSKEALELSLDKGIRYVEVDFSLTTDNKIVAIHKWNKDSYERLGIEYKGEDKPISYDEFMNCKIENKYTAMDFDDVVAYMEKYPDLYIMIDITKDLDIGITEKMYKIMSEKLAQKNLTDRVVVQAGTKEMFDTIDKIYKFPYKHFYILEKDYNNKDKFKDILAYMNSHEGFISVGAHKDYTDKSFVKKIHKNGYYFGNFPINTTKEAKKFYDMGVDYLCTDDLSYNELKDLK